MKKELFVAIWILVGVTIGAGTFALPYVFSKAGFYTGLLVMIFVGIAMTIFNLYLGEVILRTKGKHQLSGLASKYLGNKGKIIMFLASALSIYGALAAYIFGAGQALFAMFGGNTYLYYVLFFIFVSPVIYFGVNFIKGFESIFTPIKLLLVLVLSVLLFKFVDFNNITGFSLKNILVPYGVIIFAFTGVSALPEINEYLKNKRYMFWAIIFGMLITFVVYLLFILSVIGSVDVNTNQVATTAIKSLDSRIGIFANLFALVAMATAYVILAFALKENFTLDYKVSNLKSWLLVVFIPIILVLTNLFDFIKLLELSGAVAIGIILFMILLMHSRARRLGDRKPEYIITNNFILKFILSLILLLGVYYSIFVML